MNKYNLAAILIATADIDRDGEILTSFQQRKPLCNDDFNFLATPKIERQPEVWQRQGNKKGRR